MCITEYNEELHLQTVRAEARTDLLISLAADGDITLARAAELAGMELSEFQEMYESSISV